MTEKKEDKRRCLIAINHMNYGGGILFKGHMMQDDKEFLAEIADYLEKLQVQLSSIAELHVMRDKELTQIRKDIAGFRRVIFGEQK